VLSKSPYFGGGTVDMVINAPNNPRKAWHARKEMTIHEAAEEGTPAFHSIIALESAMKVHRALFGSMDQVSQHAGYLAKALYERMSSMKHANGTQVCKIYKSAASDYSDTKTQGPTIAFNVQTASGSWVPKTHFEQLAIMNNIQLRTGGVCNPGGIAHFLSWSPEELRQNFAEGLRCGNGLDVIDEKPTGIIGVSLGAMSSMKDIRTFVKFMHLFIEPTSPAVAGSALRFHYVNAGFQRLTLRMRLKKIP
jgi:molybdenum cofactor sulfurtransferase